MNKDITLHLVGGFLGSGKTTAIVTAARYFIAHGKRVGVVTNDQGKYLVDTEFVRQADLPTVEVTGGCFCCHYDDLAARLEQLANQAQPDVIFAESVGSCADLVATVIKPLQLLSNKIPPTSFSVYADSRMLRARLLDLPLPFSEDVLYIFDQQIEEAGLLVLNKTDLLNARALQETIALARDRFPQKPLLPISALNDFDIQTWLSQLHKGQIPLPSLSLSLDYDLYASGETRLAWLDAEYRIEPEPDQGRIAVVTLVRNIMGCIYSENMPVGHIKFLVKSVEGETKISFTNQEVPGWEEQIPEIQKGAIKLLVNARSETSPEHLHTVLREAVHTTNEKYHFSWQETYIEAFRPSKPQPTHHYP